MGKKLKFSEFAELIGVTPKTVYKMKDRGEIRTVIERLNGRETLVVITSDEEIQNFRSMNGKGTDINGDCEDILTDYEVIDADNNPSQYRNNVTVMEMFDKTLLLNQEYIRQINDLNEKHNDRILKLNEEYNNQIKKLNEELLNSEKQVQLLEDKAGREGFYLNEINGLKRENERLSNSKQKVNNRFLAVIGFLLLVLVGLITHNVAQSSVNESEVQKKEPVQQIVQETPKQSAKQARRKQ